jgi:hypothetical protein
MKEIGYEGLDWIYEAQDKDHFLGSCRYGGEPSGSVKARNPFKKN